MPEVQEALKDATTPMVDLDTTGNAVDIELDDSKPGLGIELSQKYLNEFDIEI